MKSPGSKSKEVIENQSGGHKSDTLQPWKIVDIDNIECQVLTLLG